MIEKAKVRDLSQFDSGEYPCIKRKMYELIGEIVEVEFKDITPVSGSRLYRIIDRGASIRDYSWLEKWLDFDIKREGKRKLYYFK